MVLNFVASRFADYILTRLRSSGRDRTPPLAAQALPGPARLDHQPKEDNTVKKRARPRTPEALSDIQYIATDPPDDRQPEKGHDGPRVLDERAPAAGAGTVRERGPKDGGEVRDREDEETVEMPRLGRMTVQQGVQGPLVAARGTRPPGQQTEGTARHPGRLQRVEIPIEKHRRNAGQHRDNPQDGLRTAV